MEKKIQSLIDNVFSNLKTLVDVNQVIGEPIAAAGAVVVPFSKVSFAFLAGGGEYSETVPKNKVCDFPYAGGSGGGAIINPVGFLVIKGDEHALIKVDKSMEGSKWTELVTSALKLVR